MMAPINSLGVTTVAATVGSHTAAATSQKRQETITRTGSEERLENRHRNATVKGIVGQAWIAPPLPFQISSKCQLYAPAHVKMCASPAAKPQLR